MQLEACIRWFSHAIINDDQGAFRYTPAGRPAVLYTIFMSLIDDLISSIRFYGLLYLLVWIFGIGVSGTILLASLYPMAAEIIAPY